MVPTLSGCGGSKLHLWIASSNMLFKLYMFCFANRIVNEWFTNLSMNVIFCISTSLKVFQVMSLWNTAESRHLPFLVDLCFLLWHLKVLTNCSSSGDQTLPFGQFSNISNTFSIKHVSGQCSARTARHARVFSTFGMAVWVTPHCRFTQSGCLCYATACFKISSASPRHSIPLKRLCTFQCTLPASRISTSQWTSFVNTTIYTSWSSTLKAVLMQVSQLFSDIMFPPQSACSVQQDMCPPVHFNKGAWHWIWRPQMNMSLLCIILIMMVNMSLTRHSSGSTTPRSSTHAWLRFFGAGIAPDVYRQIIVW